MRATLRARQSLNFVYSVELCSVPRCMGWVLANRPCTGGRPQALKPAKGGQGLSLPRLCKHGAHPYGEALAAQSARKL